MWLLLIITASINAQQQPDEFVEGIDYRLVQSKAIDTSDELDQLNQVADLEVFYWYACHACYQVEQALVEYLAGREEHQVVRTPLVAHLSWRQHAYLQPLAEQLKNHIVVPSEFDIYQACLEDCTSFKSFDSSKSWFLEKAQVEELPYIDEAMIWQAEKNYRKRADSFSISQVPTIIIRETYAVDANSAKSVERLIKIVHYLLTEKPS